jgi:hypothetical protein
MPLPMMVRSLICRFVGHSDIKRWSDAQELLPEWEERTRLLAPYSFVDTRLHFPELSRLVPRKTRLSLCP